jgi:NAD(P)-dependent dehydrogenase (short-subunit alcohol dehydrogenase family)
VKADLSKVEDCKKIVHLTDQEFGTVHSLVNVAGYTERGTILSATLENYEKNFNVNARAPFILIQEVVKIMIRDKNKGTIANLLSMAMYSGMPFLTAYSGSKAALAIMTKNIANSLTGHQIRVNALNIGWTDTPAEHDIQKRVHKKGDDWLDQEESKVPFKRLTKTIDVAKGLAFMCSDESGLMTGSVIDFDQTVNGWHSYSAYETNILDDSLLGE